MGKSFCCSIGINAVRSIVALGAILSSFARVEAGNQLLESLENGQVLSTRSGSAVLVQGLIKKDSSAVTKVLQDDLRKLPNIFTNIAFARPFTMKDSSSKEVKNLVYLKVKGLGDGAGVLMEVKQGARDAFTNARELLKSGDMGSREAATGDMSEVQDTGVLENIAQANSKNETQRILGGDTVLVLEGPLNQIDQMPATRVSVQISMAPYTMIPPAKGVAGAPAPTMKNFTLMQVRAAFGRQVPMGGELGDYRGFSDRQLMMAQAVAKNLLASAKLQLENQ